MKIEDLAQIQYGTYLYHTLHGLCYVANIVKTSSEKGGTDISISAVPIFSPNEKKFLVENELSRYSVLSEKDGEQEILEELIDQINTLELNIDPVTFRHTREGLSISEDQNWIFIHPDDLIKFYNWLKILLED